MIVYNINYAHSKIFNNPNNRVKIIVSHEMEFFPPFLSHFTLLGKEKSIDIDRKKNSLLKSILLVKHESNVSEA